MAGGSGGKGGSTTETKNLPLSLETGAQSVLASALESASLKYKPNRGVTIAAMSPMTKAAMKGANSAAEAFGMPTNADPVGYIPEAKYVGNNGVKGYSTGGLYDKAIKASMSKQDIRDRNGLLAQYAKDANKIRKIKPGTMSQTDTGGK